MFLLHELYRSDQPSANPFAQFFAELLQPQVEDDRTVAGTACGHSLSTVEKWFLAHLLISLSPKDVGMVPATYTLCQHSLSLSSSRRLLLP